MVYAYGFNPSSKQQAYVEYVEELAGDFGEFPTNPVMQWFGAITNFDDQSKINTESKPYLAPSTVTSRTGAVKNAVTGEEVGVMIDFMPQEGHFLETLRYALGANAAAPTVITDKLQSVSIGQAMTNPDWDDTKRFAKFVGMVCEDYTMSIPESGAVTCKTKWVGVGKTMGADWVGIAPGAHAVDPCTPVLQPKKVTDFMIRTSKTSNPTAWGDTVEITDALGGIDLKVTNKVGLPKDLNMYALRATGIKACVLLSRKITLGLDLTYADITNGAVDNHITFENIHSFMPFDIKYTFDGYTYEYSRVRFPELPYKAGGEDLVGDKITSLPIGDICSGTSALTITAA